ncbi:hypothetical protein ACF08N_16015 [Streptomyces sp. NPDC015127]|uniref:hypothetical protein n=1 Tax=Streptomyces sp. NPDC015127 TaxID=3364939 RepID=UPI0036FF6453
MSVLLNRALGAATAAFGVAITTRPQWLARPCGLTDEAGRVPPPTALLIRSIGARDVAICTAMLLAGDPRALRLTTACRVAADASDALIFGTLLDDRGRRLMAACSAGAWAALGAATLRGTARTHRRSR